MDRNRDGVVTIDEFIETCQKVKASSHRQVLPHGERSEFMRPCVFFPQQDENIMASMQLFENVI